MVHNLHHLARRGLEMAREQDQLKMPVWGLHVLGATMVAYFIVAFLVSLVPNASPISIQLTQSPNRSATRTTTS